MTEGLSQTQIHALQERLEQQLSQTLDDTRRILLASDDEHYIALAGEVHDLEEESVADLLVDVALADVDRHVHEIRAIEQALIRIRTGTYGSCTDCGQAIGLQRLTAYPTAPRCMACQEKYEREHAGEQHASL